MSSLLVLVLVVLAPLSRAELSSALKVVLPRLYTNLLMSLTPKLRVSRWLLWLLLWLLALVSMMLVLLLSSHAVLLVVLLLGLMWLFCGTYACGFAIVSASLISMLEMLASWARWLF
jgi:hypothetical protein